MFDLQQLGSQMHADGRLTRRFFLAYSAALAALPWTVNQTSVAVRKRFKFSSDPFTLGVASGDPGPSGVVLWTRLAPQPLEQNGGMPSEAVAVPWEVANDDAFKDVVTRGTALATPEHGHSVHVEVEGLRPDRWYFYRFHAGDAVSPIGKTRTVPAADVMPEKLKLAFASCQSFEQGLYTAYQHMAQDDLDLVFHLGDYIYEGAGKDDKVRKHHGKKIFTLDDYRARHAQYRSDKLLQNMHAACPWIVTWDDHEVENNYASDISERKDVDPAKFLLQRAAAYQAYYEMMPLRKQSTPNGPMMQLYRPASYGRLAEFLVLDTRQYRTDQPNGDKASPLNEAALSASQTILGGDQKQWLKESLQASQKTWNVLAQQVMMGLVGLPKKDGSRLYSMDQWPGYTHERLEMLQFIADAKVRNPVVLTGDIHSNWVNDLRVDDRDASTPVVATEFVGTSISSGGNGKKTPEFLDELLADNPCVKFHNQQRGYVRCTITEKAWSSDYMVVEDITKPDSPAIKRASFVVESDHPGAKPA